ncbi:MAG: apolipoprotein N-acyltransferase [Vicingaceae bacterium]|jgi:apolipoprotein N-acyltransferase
MSNIKLLLYSIASGVVMALSWPAIGELTTVILLAFTPLLFVEYEISKREGKTGFAIFCYAYLSFFIFNLVTTYWIYHASLWGACMAVICNSLFMAIVFWLFHITKKKVGKKEGYISFVLYWLAFEYLHLNWELSWTWLTLGNVFAATPENVQWYEYTGVLGGSLLVLVSNLLFFNVTLKSKKASEAFNWKGLVLFLLLPITLKVVSVFGFTTESKGEEVEVVIVQPNIDPYNEKFTTAPSDQIEKMIDLAKTKLTPTTDYLILPETAIPTAHWEHEFEVLLVTDELKKLRIISPKLKSIIGSSASVLYTPGMELKPTANEFKDGSGYYDNYNAAFQLDEYDGVQVHYKSKLVLGVEKLPFIRSIPLMKKLSINLGGTSGGLGYSEHPEVFKAPIASSVIAPIICYESIYGEYVTEYSRKGANLFAIITNDGWWDDTPGYKQHLAYASLRAIENRKWIVRSANTGISAVINDRGDILEKTTWWEPAAINAKVRLNNTITFYAQYGDYIGRIASLLAVLMIALTVVRTLNKTGNRLKR